MSRLDKPIGFPLAATDALAPTSYDHTNAIYDRMCSDCTRRAVEQCLDSANGNRLVSLTFTFADATNGNTITLPRIGPEGGTCST